MPKTLVRPAIRETLGRLDAAQKGGEGVPAYTRYVNRWLARFFVALGARVGMTPNQMTAVSALCSLVGIVLVAGARPTPVVGALAGAALLLGYVLDSADGQLARVTGAGSVTGEWIDHVVDAIRSPMIHTAVLVGWWRGAMDGPSWLLCVPIVFQLLVTGQFFSQILAEQLTRQQVLRGRLAGATPASAPTVPTTSRGRSLLRSLVVLPLDSGTLYLLFLLWGFPAVFAVGYATLLVLFVPFMIISIIRKFQALSQIGAQ